MTTILCRGRTNPEDPECDCEEYDQPADPNAPSKCRECGHGKSKHQDPPAVDQGPPAAAKKKTVLDIFSEQTAQSEKRVKALLPEKERAADPATARADALRGYRPAAEASGSKKRKGKAKAAEVKPKESTVKIVMLTCGVKNDCLRGSQKALRPADISDREDYQCVARDAVIQHSWTNQQLTRYLHELLPMPMAYGEENSCSPLWALVSKDYQRFKVLENATPTAAQVMENKVSNPKDGATVFLALNIAVPEKVYKSWYSRPCRAAAASSDIEAAEEHNSGSDYDMAQDLDADSLSDVPVSNVTGRVRKRESIASDEEEQPAKKQRLSSGLSHPMTQKASGKMREKSPLFLRSDSDSDCPFPMPLTQAVAGPSYLGASHAGPSQARRPFQAGPSSIRASAVPSERRASSNSDRRASSNSEASTSANKKCGCSNLKVSPPPVQVMPGTQNPWDSKYARSPYVNPWNSLYNPPCTPALGPLSLSPDFPPSLVSSQSTLVNPLLHYLTASIPLHSSSLRTLFFMALSVRLRRSFPPVAPSHRCSDSTLPQYIISALRIHTPRIRAHSYPQYLLLYPDST
ncbi:hypothetical protein DFH06DRAFT_1345552 [Mycena polygramma]|nr:hypothetical protein DFH06DRAFT_1345552 [Mycena polygramma]